MNSTISSLKGSRKTKGKFGNDPMFPVLSWNQIDSKGLSMSEIEINFQILN